MWDWIKRLGTTSTQRRDALELIVASQAKAIEKIMADQQKLIARQQETIDRVVAKHFDAPIERIVHPVANNQMPLFALNDQGDVRPDEIATGIQHLTVESDADFLNSVSVQ